MVHIQVIYSRLRKIKSKLRFWKSFPDLLTYAYEEIYVNMKSYYTLYFNRIKKGCVLWCEIRARWKRSSMSLKGVWKMGVRSNHSNPPKYGSGTFLFLPQTHSNFPIYILKACVQSALTYGTETWVMKANLQSLERMDVRGVAEG